VSDLGGARILVTGATGFIGSHLTTVLDARGSRVIAPVGGVAGPVRGDLPAEFVDVALDDTASLIDVVRDVDSVVHLAARSGGVQMQERSHADVAYHNARLTHSVLSAAARAGVRRVFLASSAVVYADNSRDIQESAPLLTARDRPSGYAWSKLTDEVQALWFAHGDELDPVIGRFSNVYGPGADFDPGRSTVVHALIDRVHRTEAEGEAVVWGSDSAVRGFIYVQDAAAAIAHLLINGERGEAYNIDSGVATTIHDLAALIRDVVDPSVGLRFDEDRPSGSMRRVLDVSKLRSLGFRSGTPLRQGIATTFSWYLATESG